MLSHALKHYNFINPTPTFIRHNENITYCIDDNDKSYVLRIHTPIEGFNTDILRMGKTQQELISGEIELLQHLERKGSLATQKVMQNKHGSAVTILADGAPVTVLEWIQGQTLKDIEITEDIAINIGAMIGKLHTDTAEYITPNRYSYDSTLLAKMIDEAEAAHLQGHFNKAHTAIMIDTLGHIRDYLSKAGRHILVHSDLSRSNLIWNEGKVIPIDFSLSGYCVPEMDIASIFAHINNESLEPYIIKGYQSSCDIPLEDKGIATCFCLQILLFLIAQHNKIAGESWLNQKIDNWCENHFRPLICKGWSDATHPARPGSLDDY